MSVCVVLSTMRTRQNVFLSCTPWPLTLVEGFDKKSSTWGSSAHFTHHPVQPSHRRVQEWFGCEFLVRSVGLVVVALVDSC